MKPLFAFALALNPLVVLAQVTASGDSTLVSTVSKINEGMPTSVPVIAMFGIGLLAELIMRVWPTKKPKSFLIMISAVLKGVGSICQKASDLVDQVVQNLKDDTAKTDEKK